MLLLMVCCTLLFWLVLVEWKRRNVINKTKDVKSVNMLSLPLIGQAMQFIGSDEDRMNTLKFMSREAIDNGGLAKMHMGTDLLYVVADPEIAEVTLKTCLEKGSMYECLKLFLGNGLLTAPVKIWRQRRKLVSRVFMPKNLERFIKVFSEQSQQMVEVIKENTDPDGFPMWSVLSNYTMASVWKTILGVDVSTSSNDLFLRSFERGIQLMSQRVLQPWLYMDSLYKLLPTWKVCVELQNVANGIIDQIILSTKDLLKSKKTVSEQNDNNSSDILKFKTIIEMLLQNNKDEIQFSDLEVREEVLIIALAGNDTSAAGSGFTLTMLAQHPDIQEKVLAEQMEIFGDSNRPVEASDLPKMKYLEAVIKESLRMYPPIPGIVRSIDKNVQLPSGQTLLKGTQCMVLIWGIHRNPRYWGDDAEVFRPDRFLKPLTHNAFLPFSSGPRNCVGYVYAMYSMKTALATIVRNFKILPATETEQDSSKDSMSTKFLIIMKDVENFPLRLKRRK